MGEYSTLVKDEFLTPVTVLGWEARSKANAVKYLKGLFSGSYRENEIN